MAEVLDEFPIRKSKAERFYEFFDGRVWKLLPSEFDLDDDTKSLRDRLNAAAKKRGVVIRTCVTLDGHVIVQQVDRTADEQRAVNAKVSKMRAAKARKAASEAVAS